MNGRAVVLACLLLVTVAIRSQLGAVDPTSVGSLENLPLTLEEWSGKNEPPFDASVLAVLQPDSYINRIYSDQDALAAVYVGYHRTQSQGKSIHSPLNCLPGSGWQPIRTDRVPLHTRGMANRVVIQHGEDRQLVLYWYQTMARVEGNEYWSKLHLVLDAFRWRRNDAALVRIIVPIDPRRDAGESVAERSAFRLAELVEPRVKKLLFES